MQEKAGIDQRVEIDSTTGLSFLLSRLFQLAQVAPMSLMPERGEQHDRQQTRQSYGAGCHAKRRYQCHRAESLSEQAASFAETSDPSCRSTSHLSG